MNMIIFELIWTQNPSKETNQEEARKASTQRHGTQEYVDISSSND